MTRRSNQLDARSDGNAAGGSMGVIELTRQVGVPRPESEGRCNDTGEMGKRGNETPRVLAKSRQGNADIHLFSAMPSQATYTIRLVNQAGDRRVRHNCDMLRRRKTVAKSIVVRRNAELARSAEWPFHRGP